MISEDIINTFNEIVSEFLLQMNNSSINKINMQCSLFLGIQTLTRVLELSLIHISEPTRLACISYAVC